MREKHSQKRHTVRNATQSETENHTRRAPSQSQRLRHQRASATARFGPTPRERERETDRERERDVPAQNILAGRQVGRDEDPINDLKSGLRAALAIFHALAHRRGHSELHTGRRKANAGLLHIVARDRAASPRGALWCGPFRHICAVEEDLLAAVRRPARPAEALKTNELEWCLPKCLLVQRPVRRR